MARYVTGRELGRRLCEVLGIDPEGVASVCVDCIAGHMAVVVIQRYVPADMLEPLVDELRRYRLVEEDAE